MKVTYLTKMYNKWRWHKLTNKCSLISEGDIFDNTCSLISEGDIFDNKCSLISEGDIFDNTNVA